jgi:hypothetical protein
MQRNAAPPQPDAEYDALLPPRTDRLREMLDEYEAMFPNLASPSPITETYEGLLGDYADLLEETLRLRNGLEKTATWLERLTRPVDPAGIAQQLRASAAPPHVEPSTAESACKLCGKPHPENWQCIGQLTGDDKLLAVARSRRTSAAESEMDQAYRFG